MRTLEELAQLYKMAQATIEEQEAAKVVIKEEIVEVLTEMGVDGTDTDNGYRVQKSEYTDFRGVQISEARKLGCVLTKEAVNTEKLRSLVKSSGVKIPGAKQVIRLEVTEAT